MFLNSYKIGADPEFVFLDSQNRVLEGRTFWRDAFGSATTAEVGLDHSGRVAELRPAPTKGTYTLVKSMRKALVTSPFIKGVTGVSKILAGAMAPNGDSMGGHVHFDHATLGSRFEPAVLRGLNALTEHFIAAGLFPEEDCRRRINHGYGTARDAVRFQEGRSVEYRCAPSWLYSPQVAMLYLTAAKLVPLNPADSTRLLSRKAFHNLKEFFELFVRDANAKRVLEKILEPIGSPDEIPQDPSADVREMWEQPLAF